MGFLSRLFFAAGAAAFREIAGGFRTHSFDAMDMSGSVIVIGGQSGNYRHHRYNMTSAEWLKYQAFASGIYDVLSSGIGGVFLYDGTRIPNIPATEIASIDRSRIHVLGGDINYMPLDIPDLPPSFSNAFFNQIVNNCTGYLGGSAYEINSILSMLIQSLSLIGNHYVTFRNISFLVDAMTVSQSNFQSTFSSESGFAFPYTNIFSLQWGNIMNSFVPFWYSLRNALPVSNSASSGTSSILRLLQQRHICFCDIRNELLRHIILAELALASSAGIPYYLADYYVPLNAISCPQILPNGRFRLIGDNYTQLGLISRQQQASPVLIPHHSLICLGVDAAYATDIMNQLVALSNSFSISVSNDRFGRVTLTDAQRQAISPDQLTFQRIGDGSALVINNNRFIDVRYMF